MSSLEPIPADADVDLREYLEITWRRKLLVLLVFMVTVLACAVYIRIADPVYSTEARLVVQADTDVSMVETDNPLGEMLSRAKPDSLPTQLQAMQSGPFLSEAEKRLEEKYPEPPDADVRVENLEGTEIIAVRVTSGDPGYAADLANAIVDLHIEEGQAQALRGLREALAFAEAEAARSQRLLAIAERRLMEFRKGRRIEEVTAEEQSRLREALDLRSRARQTKADLDAAEAEVRDLRRQLAEESPMTLNRMEVDNPRVQQLSDQIAELKQRRATLLIEYKETAPVVRQLDAQLRELERQLAAEPPTRVQRARVPNPIYTELAARLREREDELRRLRGQYHRVEAEVATRRAEADRTNLGPWEVQLAALTRERDQAQKLYMLFLDKVQELRIREKAHRAGARVLERASRPSRPSFPNPKRLYPVAAALGLILGLGCAFLTERLDTRVHTAEEAERLSQAGLLGQVPQIALPSTRLIGELPPHSVISESYRSLRSSISFVGLEVPVRTLLVTSVDRGDGKSLTCANLAGAMALDGKRIILVDADLRRPAVHTLVRAAQQPGLTDVLRGDCALEAAIQPTETPGFDVLCSGPIPHNPSELLNTRAMTEVLEQLAARYDTVLIDSSPCTLVTDPLVLSHKVDGVLLVVDVSKTHREALRTARHLLDRARANVIGLVLNRVKRSGTRGYGRYGYSYFRPFSGREVEDFRPEPDRAAERGNGRREPVETALGTLPPLGGPGAKETPERPDAAG